MAGIRPCGLQAMQHFSMLHSDSLHSTPLAGPFPTPPQTGNSKRGGPPVSAPFESLNRAFSLNDRS